MRVSQDEKDRSHTRIVESAARLFRERGVMGASVGDVMKDAGLTHGGFYRHFQTKDALLVSALEVAFAQMTSPLLNQLADNSPAVVRESFQALYLSDGHVASPGIGCPVAALSGDVARESDAVKDAFGVGINSMIEALARTVQGLEAHRRASATRELAMMVGAVMIARAADPATAQAVLSACRSSPKSGKSKQKAGVHSKTGSVKKRQRRSS